MALKKDSKSIGSDQEKSQNEDSSLVGKNLHFETFPAHYQESYYLFLKPF